MNFEKEQAKDENYQGLKLLYGPVTLIQDNRFIKVNFHPEHSTYLVDGEAIWFVLVKDG